MALSSYVYDVAIGSNMDTLLARLAAAENARRLAKRSERLRGPHDDPMTP